MFLEFHKKKWSFRVSIASLVISLVLSLSAALLLVAYRESTRGAVHSAKDLFNAISGKLFEQTSGLLSSVVLLTESGAGLAGMYPPPGENGADPRLLEFMRQALTRNPYIYSVTAGYPDGSLVQIIASRSDTRTLQAHGAPPETAFIVRTLHPGPGEFSLDESCIDLQGRALSSRRENDQNIIRNLVHSQNFSVLMDTPLFTKPTIIPEIQLPGITCIGTDRMRTTLFSVVVTLYGFDNFFWNQEVSPSGSAFLFDAEHFLLAHPKEPVVSVARKGMEEELWFLRLDQSTRAEVRAIAAILNKQGAAAMNTEQIWPVDGQPYLMRLTGIEKSGFNGIVAVVAPVSDFTGHIRLMQWRILILSALALLVAVIAAFHLSRRVSGALSSLALQADLVQKLDFSDQPLLHSRFIEIHTLIESFTLMRQTIRRRTEDLLTAQQDLQRLMDSFIRVIAGAIDAKSPHTGRHCSRMPELAELLAREAADSHAGELAAFSPASEEEWHELRIAAWLHDCGKVTTPEYITDKGAKLETMYNRIHEIRMRFEVLSRDLEIAWLREQRPPQEGTDPDGSRLQAQQRELREEFALVARCNLGSEAMGDTDRTRIMEIAHRTWQRRFDDSLGLAAEELERQKKVWPQGSPLVQHLLSDRPEHRIPHQSGRMDHHGNESAKQPGSRNCAKLQRPAHRLDLGELHNLLISKGTLTPEERYLIQEHILQTIHMLEQLPFPAHLARVPGYAGAHHELLDGSGYPFGLRHEEIPIPARIMAIADIFEALTAWDRPYKQALTVRQAFAILETMAKKGQIDSDLLQLLQKSGAWRTYAAKHLQLEQIDC